MITLRTYGGSAIDYFIEYGYNLSIESLFFLTISSIIITILLNQFSSNYDVIEEGEIIKINKYSFLSKAVAVFIILILFYIPIFKLL